MSDWSDLSFEDDDNGNKAGSDEAVQDVEMKEDREEPRSLSLDTLKRLTDEYFHWMQEQQRLNALAEQLKAALEFRRDVELCAAQAKPRVAVDVKMDTLFDDSHLSRVHLVNGSDRTLEGWTLTLTERRLRESKEYGPSSNTCTAIPLPSLPPGASHSAVFHSSCDAPREWPIAVEVALERVFNISERANYAVNVRLEPRLLSVLQLFRACERQERPQKLESLFVPSDLFDRIVKEQLPSGAGTVLDQAVHIAADKDGEGKRIKISVHCSSASLLRSLVRAVQCLCLLGNARRCGKDIEVIPASDSLDDLFASAFGSLC